MVVLVKFGRVPEASKGPAHVRLYLAVLVLKVFVLASAGCVDGSDDDSWRRTQSFSTFSQYRLV